jgi:hypothetical protein
VALSKRLLAFSALNSFHYFVWMECLKTAGFVSESSQLFPPPAVAVAAQCGSIAELRMSIVTIAGTSVR